MSDVDCQVPHSPVLQGQRVAFVGRLTGMARSEALQLVRDFGGACVERPDQATLVVVGDSEPTSASRRAGEWGRGEVIREADLWERLGLVDHDRHVHRLYTLGMLAELIGIPAAVLRQWHRRGFLVAAREVRRLPYFDFLEVATARKLAELTAAGCSQASIARRLEELKRLMPLFDRPLAQLSIVIEGRQLLVRQGDGLREPGGQLRFDFDIDDADSDADGETSDAHSEADDPAPPTSREALLEAAAELESAGQLGEAADMYRAALAAGGPQAEANFLLAELLYRLGDLAAARERYYVALEIDEDYVEARSNLGCVLAELGQRELAVAAFRGALACHEEYPDVHYHLARTLDDLQRPTEAEVHWQAFLKLAPDSPWADEAEARCGLHGES